MTAQWQLAALVAAVLIGPVALGSMRRDPYLWMAVLTGLFPVMLVAFAAAALLP